MLRFFDLGTAQTKPCGVNALIVRRELGGIDRLPPGPEETEENSRRTSFWFILKHQILCLLAITI